MLQLVPYLAGGALLGLLLRKKTPAATPANSGKDGPGVGQQVRPDDPGERGRLRGGVPRGPRPQDRRGKLTRRIERLEKAVKKQRRNPGSGSASIPSPETDKPSQGTTPTETPPDNAAVTAPENGGETDKPQ